MCGPDGRRQRLQAVTRNDLSSLLRSSLQALVPCNDRNLGQLEHCPAANCNEIPLEQNPVLRPSGYNWVRSSNGTAVEVYCDMDRVCGCSSTGGWTRIAHLNMSDPSQQCPGEWTLQTYTSEPRRLCGGINSGPGCLSAMYSTYGISYSQVCGRVIGYVYRSPDAFSSAIANPSIDSNYVDGVSVTHGPSGSRQHIWTFAGGLVEQAHTTSNLVCPCGDRPSRTVVPSFVGNDYFCESGNPGTSWELYCMRMTHSGMVRAADPLPAVSCATHLG